MTQKAPFDQSSAGLIADVLAGLSRLVRGEIALARAEAMNAARSAASSLVWFLGAALFAVVAVALVAMAAVHGLVSAGFSPAMACLSVAAVAALCALATACSGRAMLRDAGRFSDRPARNVRRDLQTLQTMVTENEPRA